MPEGERRKEEKGVKGKNKRKAEREREVRRKEGVMCWEE